MAYREIGISIRSAYSQGWPDDASRLAFRTETRKLFRNAGWQVEEMPLDSGHCDTVRNGKDALYLHPTVFSGVMQEDHITALQRLLDEANTFRTLGTRLYRECFDLTDEEYRQRLEEQAGQIDNAILEACRTKRRNLFHTGSIAERIGRQLFKLAVEQNVNNHILASDTDIDARSYQKMRGLSMDEVKRTNGRIDFEDALLGERGV